MTLAAIALPARDDAPISSHRGAGYTLLETLVSLFVLALGLLGLAGLQSRASIAEMEAYQRSQALVLAQDMVERITANSSALRADIDNGTALTVYKTTQNSTAVGSTVQTCTGSGAAFDLCEWGNQIAGAAGKAADKGGLGTLGTGRGCVRQPDATDPYLYLVVVSWQASGASKAPPSSVDCGTADAAAPLHTSETQRQAVAVTVRITKLL